jgi:putative endonuclease
MNIKNKIRPCLNSSQNKTVKTSQRSRQVGGYGQNLAKDFLQQRGYEVLTENYYTRSGEIDLICQKNSQIIFIEVKTRSSNNYGIPEEAISKIKKEKLRKTALYYLQEQTIVNENWRIDSVAVEISKINKIAQIRHHKNIY